MKIEDDLRKRETINGYGEQKRQIERLKVIE